MPLNPDQNINPTAYRPSKEDEAFVLEVVARIRELKTYRSALKANPYDVSSKARTIENTWDFDDYVSLPHKYSHPELRSWQASNSRPLIFQKIDTALSILVSKNPEVEISARSKRYEKKSQLIEALYNQSWEEGNGRQQLIKFVYSVAKYGFGVGREYHRYQTQDYEEVVSYDPEKFQHVTEKKNRIMHDEAYFEVLPIRDCWFDHRAKPYDEDSIRDWCWRVRYDYSTFQKLFPKERYPNAQYVGANNNGSATESRSKADVADVINTPSVELYFYEDTENNEFVITDLNVLVYRGILLNRELSCVTGMWRIRNEDTIYGIGLPEILENNQELYDKVANMTINQIMLSISGSGFYGGTGNLQEQDAILEPKLKKLRDAEKIIFPKIPGPDMTVFRAIEDIKNEADEVSGVTKSLTGEVVGKTLGEAMLNKEAGLQRLKLPLQNIEFSLERHAKLRVKNMQRIYSKPVRTEIVRDSLGIIVNEKLWMEYVQERERLGSESLSLIQKFPTNPNDPNAALTVMRNSFPEKRLPLQKDQNGETLLSEKDQFLEITPEEIEGEYDIKIRAFSTIPMSKELESSKALETFNLFAKMPYVDLYKLQKNTLMKRGEDPDDILFTEDQITQQQQQAGEARDMKAQAEQDMALQQQGGETTSVVPPNEMEQSPVSAGISSQFSQTF
jgi:hypothetical protein